MSYKRESYMTDSEALELARKYLKTEKRHAKVGDKILMIASHFRYSAGRVLTVESISFGYMGPSKTGYIHKVAEDKCEMPIGPDYYEVIIGEVGHE